MIFYNILNNNIKFFNDDKSLGVISFPDIKSSLFREIYLKTCIMLVMCNFSKYNQIKIPINKLLFYSSDIEYLNTFRTILDMAPVQLLSEKVIEEVNRPTFIGTATKKTNKHIVFFSGGKESWYKILYLLTILKINQEDILIIYANKWNSTCNREAKAIVALHQKYPKINIKSIDIQITIKKTHAYALEYLVILAAALEQIFIFNGGTNIHFGFSNLSWENKDTFIDSFSETIEAEKLYYEYLKKYNVLLDHIVRMEIPEDVLYDYKLFNEYGMIDNIISCIVPDGLASLSRNKFTQNFPMFVEFVDDTMCCFCTKCILKFFNRVKYLKTETSWYKKNKDALVKVMSKHITNKLVKIQNTSLERQFFNYDIHFLSYVYTIFSEFSKKMK